jgi:hypothetical protein
VRYIVYIIILWECVIVIFLGFYRKKAIGYKDGRDIGAKGKFYTQEGSSQR